MDSTKKDARFAGLLYLLMVITGPFVLLYVPGKLFVAGDAAATAANILAHEGLVRAHIVVGLISEFAFIATVLVLYRLLKGVNAGAAAAMVILVLVDAPLAFLGVANEIATLAFVRGGDVLAAFDKPQRDALATLLLAIDRHGSLVSEMFWGLWLLPLGWLIYRSGFLPRLIGAWVFANGLAYAAISATGMLAPDYYKAANTYLMPVLFGEVALMLWLLIVGARAVTPEAPEARAGGTA